MSAVEALALAHAEGVRVSLAGDWFIRWQSPGELPPHVRSALTAAKPEIVDLLRRFRLDETWALDATGGNDDARLLAKLAALDFRVRFYGAQAALDDDAGQGRVPPMPLLYQLRERQVRRTAARPSGSQHVEGGRAMTRFLSWRLRPGFTFIRA
jgi:hypothetical protein